MLVERTAAVLRRKATIEYLVYVGAKIYKLAECN